MSESLVRSPNEVIGASCASLVTPRTFGTPCTILSTSARTASAGTSPVISAARLNAATFTCTLSAKRSTIRLPARSSIASSSSCVPEERRSSGTQLDDDAIELRAGSRIVDRFADQVHVNVAAFNRAALITGEVPGETVRAEVEKIVQGVPNVRGVTNEAQLAPITSFGERTSDSLITAQVKTRYLRANEIGRASCRERV